MKSEQINTEEEKPFFVWVNATGSDANIGTFSASTAEEAFDLAAQLMGYDDLEDLEIQTEETSNFVTEVLVTFNKLKAVEQTIAYENELDRFDEDELPIGSEECWTYISDRLNSLGRVFTPGGFNTLAVTE